MADVLGGYQPDTKASSSRRADFDLRRRIAALEAGGGGGGIDLPPGGDPGEVLTVDGGGDPVWAAIPDQVPDPAYAGPRRDSYTDQAMFSHVAVSGGIGYSLVDNGSLQIIAGPGQPIGFWRATGTAAAPTGYTPLGLFDAGGRLLVGKGASDGGVAGSELHPTGNLTNVVGDGSGTSANQYLNHVASRDSNGSMYLNLSRSTSNTNIGSITQVGTTGVAYNTASDYRLKDEIGPVPDALTRLHELRPIRFAWKDGGAEVDGFLAHEVQEVIPEAVTGTKDAEDDDGNPVYQGIDQSKLVPLLIAAVQELAAQVAALQAAP